MPQVGRACPDSWLSVVIDGTGRPGSRSSFKICCRRRAANPTCDRGLPRPDQQAASRAHCTSEVYHSSPWSSSLVADRQMRRRTGSRRFGGTPGVRDDGHARLRIPGAVPYCPVAALNFTTRFRRHPPAVLNLNALGLGPLPDRGGVGSVGTGRLTPAPAWPPGSRARRPTRGIDVSCQCFPQRVGILSAQVDLVLRAIQPEAHGSLCVAAIEVIDKQSLYLLSHR